MNVNISQLTPKQLQKLQNRMNNERQRLAKAERKAVMHKQPSVVTGLSKGQRRRLNARSRGMNSSSIPRIPTSSSSLTTTDWQAMGRSTNYTRQESLGPVYGSVNFATTSYYVNPGQASTFPWLAPAAGRFEKWMANYVEFYFARTVNQYATAGQQGRVCLSHDYDASDNPPGTIIQAENTFPRAIGSPSDKIISLVLSPRELCTQDSKYVRPGMVPAGSDPKTYDGGIFSFSTEGMVNTDKIGELYVRYNIDLSIPVLENEAAAPPNFHSALFQGVSSLTSPAVGQPLLLTSIVNPLGITITGGSLLTLPPGNFEILWNLQSLCSSSDSSFVAVNDGGFSLWTQSTIGDNTIMSGTRFIQSDGTAPFLLTFDSDGTTFSVSTQVYVHAV